jgi:hypothetical protein
MQHFGNASKICLALVAMGMLMLTAGCRGEDFPLTLANTASAEEFTAVNYELTSDVYRKWLAAQENLARDAGDADLGLPAERILLTNPSPTSIDGVVRALEENERTRRAIESADLSVRDYVLTTLALYQATDRPDTLGLVPGGVAIPTRNIELARENAPQISTARASSRVRIVDDRARRDGGGKAKERGKGRGKGKGRR